MKCNNTGFTLIELLISMTIFFIIVIMSYANYAYYQNIARVKIGLKEISQSLSEARNLAIAGYEKNGVNQSIGVYFDLEDRNMIRMYSYDYSGAILIDETHLLKEKKLQQHVGIDALSGKQNILVYFSSIYAKPQIYYFDGGIKKDYIGEEIDFIVSFKGATHFPLKRELKYIKNTNVVDY